MIPEGPDVTIEALAAGGSGVAHLPDGMIVFVPRTAPGDQVRLNAVRVRKRHAEAQVAELLVAGPGRIEPPCPHFTADRCGGCQWQHLSAPTQQAGKRRIVGDALRRIGKLDVADPELVGSPRQLAYRTTMTLTVRRRGRHAVVGYHDAFDPDRVFMLDKCFIARDELNALWAAVRPAADALPHGEDVRLKLRLAADGTRHVMVDGGEGAWTGARQVEQALETAGQLATLWWQPPSGVTRRVGGAPGDQAEVAFAQVNAEVAELLKAAVVEQAGRREAGKAGRILDLYAGAGDTALPLAGQGHDVTMVELDRRAVRRAEERAAAAGLTLRAIVGGVEAHLAKLLPADVVIVNPPRSGLSEEVATQLAASPPSRLVYVSCDPATLARDLRRLAFVPITHHPSLITCFDMFPQTSHVETLAVLDLKQAA